MASMKYRRPSRLGITHVRLTPGRRRILLALLTGARNLHGFRLCQAAQVWSASLYPFLGHLEQAGWVIAEKRSADGRELYSYDLTDIGREQAAAMLHLDIPGKG